MLPTVRQEGETDFFWCIYFSAVTIWFISSPESWQSQLSLSVVGLLAVAVSDRRQRRARSKYDQQHATPGDGSLDALQSESLESEEQVAA